MKALIIGTAIATLIGCGVVWWLGPPGIIVATIAAPAAGLGCLLLIRLPPVPKSSGALAPDWSRLVRLGLPLMMIAQMSLIAPMAIRIGVTHTDGLYQAGLFQAAWTISAHAMTILLTAVAMDFYPRISTLRQNSVAIRACLVRQVHLHLGLGGPLLLLIAGAAPLTLTALFSAEFAPASGLFGSTSAASRVVLFSSKGQICARSTPLIRWVWNRSSIPAPCNSPSFSL